MVGTQLDPSSDDPIAAGHVDTADVPSAAWGWSHENRTLMRVAGWFFAIFLLLMLIGNHSGKVEDMYLIGFAAAIIILLVRDIILRRRPR